MILHEEYLIVPALASHLPKFHEMLDRFWLNVERIVGECRCNQLKLSFTTAMMEIVCNVMRHAYPIEMAVGPLSLRLRLYHDRCEALLLDKGMMFIAPTTPPIVNSQLNICDLPESGFGLQIARRSVDQLDYCRHADGSNQWLLIKKIRS